MTASSALRAKAEAKYPAFPVDFEDGSIITLKSIMALSKNQRKDFSESSKRLGALDEEEDIDGLHATFVTILAGVSDNPEELTIRLEDESLGYLTVLFEEYAGSLSDGSKSA